MTYTQAINKYCALMENAYFDFEVEVLSEGGFADRASATKFGDIKSAKGFGAKAKTFFIAMIGKLINLCRLVKKGLLNLADKIKTKFKNRKAVRAKKAIEVMDAKMAKHDINTLLVMLNKIANGVSVSEIEMPKVTKVKKIAKGETLSEAEVNNAIIQASDLAREAEPKLQAIKKVIEGMNADKTIDQKTYEAASSAMRVIQEKITRAYKDAEILMNDIISEVEAYEEFYGKYYSSGEPKFYSSENPSRRQKNIEEREQEVADWQDMVNTSESAIAYRRAALLKEAADILGVTMTESNIFTRSRLDKMSRGDASLKKLEKVKFVSYPKGADRLVAALTKVVARLGKFTTVDELAAFDVTSALDPITANIDKVKDAAAVTDMVIIDRLKEFVSTCNAAQAAASVADKQFYKAYTSKMKEVNAAFKQLQALIKIQYKGEAPREKGQKKDAVVKTVQEAVNALYEAAIEAGDGEQAEAYIEKAEQLQQAIEDIPEETPVATDDYDPDVNGGEGEEVTFEELSDIIDDEKEAIEIMTDDEGSMIVDAADQDDVDDDDDETEESEADDDDDDTVTESVFIRL